MASPVLRGPFTVETYRRLGELGILREDDRVELIDGQVVAMTPIGDRHASCVRRLLDVFSRDARELAITDVQNPVVLGPNDSPQPDVVLLTRRPGGYPRHPRPPDILLVIEVADTSLSYDRDTKIPLYAQAGIPEAWLVDLVAENITVYRRPVPDGYSETASVARGELLRPLLLAGVTITADEILS